MVMQPALSYTAPELVVGAQQSAGGLFSAADVFSLGELGSTTKAVLTDVAGCVTDQDVHLLYAIVCMPGQCSDCPATACDALAWQASACNSTPAAISHLSTSTTSFHVSKHA